MFQLINKLKGAKMFTKMNLWWGYNNIWIKERNKWKVAFMCYRGFFKPLVMFFRLCNSPRMFQAMMNKIFADMEDVCIVYINDFMIFMKSNSKEEHDKVVLEMLCCLEKNNLFIKPKMYMFYMEEVEFLGMIMGKDGIHTDNSKVKAILEWPEPKKIKGVKSFLRLTNFYQQFISGYAQVTQPLNNLTKRDMPFIWGNAQQQAFNMLKENFTMAPILTYPDNDCKFHLECDSSDFAMGPCYLFSKTTSGIQLPMLPTPWAQKNGIILSLTKRCWA